MLKHDHDHCPEAIARRLQSGPQVHYLREWVYGGIDGVVTTFAIIAAVIGADLSIVTVLILGAANLIGDGFSMAAGAFSSMKAESDNYDRLREIESMHIEKYRDGELEETRQILEIKGFKGDDLQKMMDGITHNKNLWIEFMLTEEYGVSKPIYTPIKAGMHTFLAFVFCGVMPLLPFVFSFPYVELMALGMAAFTFFMIGSLKSRWSLHSWWREGASTTFIGLTAAGLAYLIGFGLDYYIL